MPGAKSLALLVALSVAPLSAILADDPGTPAAGAPATAMPLADQLARLQAPQVGPRVALPDGELRVGHAVLRPRPASTVRRLLVGDRTVGVIFDGGVALVYRVEDPFSVPVAKRNLRSSTGLSPRADGAALVIEKVLEGAAVWGYGLLPDAELATTAEPPPPPAPLPEWLAELMSKKLGENPALDLLVSSAQGDAGYRWAALHASGDDYVLDVDPRPAVAIEQLSRYQPIDRAARIYGGRWNAHGLVTQPTAAHWWDARPLDFATTATAIDLVNPSGTQATITSRLTVQALRNGLTLLPFSLRSKFEDTDANVRELRVVGLTAAGQPADYVHDEGLLLVALPRPLRAGESVELEVRTAGDILDRPDGNSYWILRTESWYPKPRSTGAEHSTFRLSVESADPLVPFASGEIVSREKTPTGTRVTTRIDVPTEHAAVIAGRYTTFDQEHDGARVHVSTYASAKKAEAERVAGIVFGVRSCLEGWLGVPFPFQDLEMVEIVDWGWGQAPPGVVFITKEAFLTPARTQLDEEPDVAAWYTRGINERIAHEIAHSWFPHVAKVRRAEENWLSESFADYASVECLRTSMRDQKKGAAMFDRAIRDWKFGAKEIGDGGSIYLASHLSGDRDSDFYAWRALLYSKGPLVLHALRQELRKEMGEQKGESAFLTWIRAYIQNFTFKTGETRHLVGILNQITGKDWQPWFEKYVYGTDMPTVK
jgi:hypothetical protein